ncbi:hypothetical protein CEXT_562001 [Caerostris extrusa]|uniref:Uncharacterized protein n=1 Tax=Caerostris extrusa TaxID=172846 RepID=A0AAV4NNW5_CAEEX|nr:hypothetical protein CEXT_562001 [Caerostris extrusa]
MSTNLLSPVIEVLQAVLEEVAIRDARHGQPGNQCSVSVPMSTLECSRGVPRRRAEGRVLRGNAQKTSVASSLSPICLHRMLASHPKQTSQPPVPTQNASIVFNHSTGNLSHCTQ